MIGPKEFNHFIILTDRVKDLLSLPPQTIGDYKMKVEIKKEGMVIATGERSGNMVEINIDKEV